MGAQPAIAATPAASLLQASAAPAWQTFVSAVAIDVIALSAVYWLAVLGRYLTSSGSFHFYIELFPGIILFILAFSVQGLYPGVLLHPAEEMRRVFHCVSSVFLLVLCTTFIWHTAELYSRSIFLVVWALGAPAVLLARYTVRPFLARRRWWGVPAVIFGSGPAAQRVIRTLSNTRLGVRVIAVVGNLTPLSNESRSPGLDTGRAHLSKCRPHYAILVTSSNSDWELRHAIQDHCKGFRHILLVPDIPGICSLGISAREIGGEIGFEVPQRLFHRTAGFVKRILDIALSIICLVLLSPILILIWLAVRFSSPGPVFYRHYRHGRDGLTFKALKFRTMATNADQLLIQHLRDHPEELLSWQRDYKLKHDPRVTSIGKWLRRYSLDELPQLFNVVLGQMSLVGPRPIVAAEITKYGRGYDLYTRVLPGITGLWQVSGRNNTTYNERVTFDEYYVRNWSIWLDAYILVRTLKAVFSAEGAY